MNPQLIVIFWFFEISAKIEKKNLSCELEIENSLRDGPRVLFVEEYLG